MVIPFNLLQINATIKRNTCGLCPRRLTQVPEAVLATHNCYLPILILCLKESNQPIVPTLVRHCCLSGKVSQRNHTC